MRGWYSVVSVEVLFVHLCVCFRSVHYAHTGRANPEVKDRLANPTPERGFAAFNDEGCK
jgi:hypothetical protein